MAKIKPRKTRMLEYTENYEHIPKDDRERIQYLLDTLGYTSEDLKRVHSKVADIINNMEYGLITFTLYEEPIPYMRARENFRTPLATENSKYIADFMKATLEGVKMIVTPCELLLDIYVKPLADMKKDTLVLAEMGIVKVTNRPDIDNIVKGYLDAFNNNLLYDDALVCDARIRKFYSIKPRLEFVIKYQKTFEVEYNLKRLMKSKKFKEMDIKITNLGGNTNG